MVSLQGQYTPAPADSVLFQCCHVVIMGPNPDCARPA